MSLDNDEQRVIREALLAFVDRMDGVEGRGADLQKAQALLGRLREED